MERGLFLRCRGELLWAVPVAFFCLLAGGLQAQQVQEVQEEKAAAPAGPPAVQVVGYRSRISPLAQTLSLVGTLAANEAVEITSEIDGIAEKILFDEGESVKAGQILIEIDSGKLKASLDKAQADLQLAEATRQRFEGLGTSGAVSRQEVDRSVAEFEAAKAAVALAEEQLKEASISAPFDGVMGARYVSPGQFVVRGQPLSSLISQDPMKAEVRVPERFLSQLAAGQTVQVRVAAYPEETFTGEVYFIDPQIDEETRTALVKAKVPNGAGKLKRGMFATLELIVTVRENAIVVPETALLWNGDVASLFVVGEAGEVELRQVRPGIRQAGIVEIIEGLSEGETVVVEGTQKLGPGSFVQVRYE